MKDLFVADVVKIIKDTEKYPVTIEMVETLDEMLSEYGVTHFFSYPIDSTDGIANNAEDYLAIFYDKKDNLTFNLVYALWCKTTRQVEDEILCKALRKM